MSVVERVMKAYISKHDLKPEQVAMVRAELSGFIGELIAGKRRESTMPSDMKNAAASRRVALRDH